MRDSFWGLIWESFLEIQGVLVGFLGVIVSLLAWRFQLQTQISLPLVMTIVIFTLIVIITLGKAVDKALKNYKSIKQGLIPKILYAKKEKSTGFIVCLLETTNLLATGLMISFFYRNEYGMEVSIGIGYVKNVQTDGKIQAVIDQPISVYQDILDNLSNNNQTVLDKVIVRPGITKNFFNQP